MSPETARDRGVYDVVVAGGGPAGGDGDKISFRVGRQGWWNFTSLNNNIS